MKLLQIIIAAMAMAVLGAAMARSAMPGRIPLKEAEPENYTRYLEDNQTEPVEF